MKFLLATVAALGFATAAHAYEVDTMAQFMARSSRQAPPPIQQQAGGYALGIFEMGVDGKALCLPAGMAEEAIGPTAGKALMDYVKAHPEAAEQPAPEVILNALRAAFPCQAEGAKRG